MWIYYFWLFGFGLHLFTVAYSIARGLLQRCCISYKIYERCVVWKFFSYITWVLFVDVLFLQFPSTQSCINLFLKFCVFLFLLMLLNLALFGHTDCNSWSCWGFWSRKDIWATRPNRLVISSTLFFDAAVFKTCWN